MASWSSSSTPGAPTTKRWHGRALGTEIIQEAFVNARAQHRECWLRDPDGYVVVLAGPGRAID